MCKQQIRSDVLRGWYIHGLPRYQDNGNKKTTCGRKESVGNKERHHVFGDHVFLNRIATWRSGNGSILEGAKQRAHFGKESSEYTKTKIKLEKQEIPLSNCGVTAYWEKFGVA